MNPSTLIGMLVGVLVIAGTVYFSADNPVAFFNANGFLLVLGGTIAATFISYPIGEVLKVLRVFMIVLRNERLYEKQDIEELVLVAKLMMQGEINKVDDRLKQLKNPFLRTGIQMVIDNTPLEDVTGLLQWRIARVKARERAEAQIFRTMATFAPSFGMLGTLLGLINMLYSMDAQGFQSLGYNMSLAMVTTLYGIVLANLLFKPIALKLERRTEHRVMLMNMMLEGILLMHEKRSPAFIRETLKSFMAQHEDELRDVSPVQKGRRK